MSTWKGHGDGILSTIRKSDGAQVFACRVIWNGKPYTETAGTTKGEAYALKVQREREIAAGTYLPPKIRKQRDRAEAAAAKKTAAEAAAARPTLKQWAAERIEVKRAHLKARSWDQFRDRCVKFTSAPIGARYLDELTRREVEQWASTLRGENGREINVKPYLDTLKNVLFDAVRSELIPSNPAAGLKAPKPKRVRRKGVCIDPADRAKLIAAARPEFRPALRVAFLIGARWGELSALEWSDVDLERRQLTIARSIGEATTKTGEARTIPLNDDTLAVLSKLPTRFAGGLVFTVRGKPLAEVTPGPRRAARTTRYLDLWNQALRASGLAGIRPHDTRHTAASDFVMRTGNLFAACKLFGWSNYKMVEQVYGHLTQGFLAAEMQKLNGAAGVIP